MRIPLVHSHKVTNDKIILTFETGENRYFLLENLVKHLNSTGFAIFTLEDFKMINVIEGSIKFLSKPVSFKKRNGEFINDYYDIDPCYIYEDSLPMEETIGELFKKYRINEGLSTSEVAELCKSDKGFISKFENNKLQVEWNTIRKLFFLGFRKTVNLEMMFSHRVRRVDKYMDAVTFILNKDMKDISLKIPSIRRKQQEQSLTFRSLQPAQSMRIMGLAHAAPFQASSLSNLRGIKTDEASISFKYSKRVSQKLDTAIKWQ